MLSRVKELWDTVFCDEHGNPKQGHEYQTIHNMYNAAETGIILRWRDGKLNDDGDMPAVEFQDTHIEHYRNGLLHNEGKPAIISDYGLKTEFYIEGVQQ